MVRQHHLLNGQEFEQTLGDSEVQGSLECCSSWSHRIGHDLVTENNNSISELLELWFVIINFRIFSSVQFSSVTQSCPTLCDPMNRSMPGLPVHHQLPEFTQTHVHQVSDAIQPSHPLSSPSPPAPNPSQHQSFSNESTLCMRWSKYWSFSFRISPSKEIPGLISLRMDWLDLLAVQGILKSLLQHHSLKASILQRSAFFTVQLSHPYMTAGKTTVLTRWTFVGKVMSLLFNMLSRLVINFLPRSKHLLISWKFGILHSVISSNDFSSHSEVLILCQLYHLILIQSS